MAAQMRAFVRGAQFEPNPMPLALPKGSRSRTDAVWNASTTKTARSARIWSAPRGVACLQTPRNVRRTRIVRPMRFATTHGAAERVRLVLAVPNPIVAKLKRVTQTAFADFRAIANVSHRPNAWQNREMCVVPALAVQRPARKTDAVWESFASSRLASPRASARWLSLPGVTSKKEKPESNDSGS